MLPGYRRHNLRAFSDRSICIRTNASCTVNHLFLPLIYDNSRIQIHPVEPRWLDFGVEIRPDDHVDPGHRQHGQGDLAVLFLSSEGTVCSSALDDVIVKELVQCFGRCSLTDKEAVFDFVDQRRERTTARRRP